MSAAPPVDRAGTVRGLPRLVLLVQAGSGTPEESCLRDLGYIVIGPIGTVGVARKILRSLIPDGAVLDTGAGRRTLTFAAHRLKVLDVPFLLIEDGGPLELANPFLAAAPALPRTLVKRHLGEFMRSLLRPSHAAHGSLGARRPAANLGEGSAASR